MSHEAPTCRTCGTDRFVAKGWKYQTCVGYYSPTGHNHDDNCFARMVAKARRSASNGRR